MLGTTPSNAELFAKLGGTPSTNGSFKIGLVYSYTVAATSPCTVVAATVTVDKTAVADAGAAFTKHMYIKPWKKQSVLPIALDYVCLVANGGGLNAIANQRRIKYNNLYL
jgi:hypothetical protein